jgi:hypothetical protein
VRIDKADGGVQPLAFSSKVSSPWGMVLEDAGAAGLRVVVGEARGGGNAHVYQCDPSNCPTTTDVGGSGDDNIRYLVVDGPTLYWAESNGGGGNRIRSCTLGNCASTLATASSTNEMNAWGLTLVGGTLYWTRNAKPPPGGVRSVTVDGGNDTDVATGQDGAQGIATDGTRLFWANANANAIMTCAAAGCDAGAFATVPTPQHVLVDEGVVYWSEGIAAGAIAYCPTSGCAAGPRLLVSGQQTPLWIAADRKAIYWTNSYSGGQVMKIAKPLP